MSRGPKWSAEETSFLKGVIQEHGMPKGNNFSGWSEEIKQMVRARLQRSDSSVYQHVMGKLKSRSSNVSDNTEFMLTTGA